MRLRKSIRAPSRYDEEILMPSSSRNGTKPTYPDLLRGQIIPFNPNNPPAAFPSVSLTTTQSLEPVANLSEISSEVSFTQRPLSAHDLDMSFSTTIDTDSTQPPQTQEENEVSNIDGATTSDRDRMDLDDLTSPAVSTEASKPMMTEATNADSKESSAPGWSSLPLSLQYHIYTALSGRYSSKSLIKILALTNGESTQIQKAVGLRSLHPATVAEIWEYCHRAGAKLPGFPPPYSFVDVDCFNEFMDYMVFASNYEFAYAPELQRAKRYLSSRSIPTELLGTWLPDPSEPNGSELLTHIAAMGTRISVLDGEHPIDSEFSSLSHVDHGSWQGTADRTAHHGLSGIEKIGDDRSRPRGYARHMTLGTSIHATDRITTPMAILRDLTPAPGTKPGHHLSANTTQPGRSPKPPPNRRNDPENGTNHRQSASHSTSVRLPAVAANTNQTPTQKQDHHPHHPTSKAREQCPTTPSRPNPGRLVMKIHNNDGLAKVMKKKMMMRVKPVDDITTTGAGIESLCTPDGEVDTCSPSSHHGREPQATDPILRLKLKTTMSSFSKSLLGEDGPVSSLDKESREELGHRGTGLPIRNHTREGDDLGVQVSTNTANTMDLVQRSKDSGGIPVEYLRSPSYSPIPENNNLPEFLALLQGPKAN